MSSTTRRSRHLSPTTAQVLKVLLGREAGPVYGYEVIKDTGLPSGTVYPILANLSQKGWVREEWEHLDPSAAGRPARRNYTLTPEGRAQGLAALRALAEIYQPPPEREGAPHE